MQFFVIVLKWFIYYNNITKFLKSIYGIPKVSVDPSGHHYEKFGSTTGFNIIKKKNDLNKIIIPSSGRNLHVLSSFTQKSVMSGLP